MGDSSQTQTSQTAGTNSNTTSASSGSTKDPWSFAIPSLTGILNQAGALNSTTTNPALGSALTTGQNTAIANATAGGTTALANQGMGSVSNLLSSGGLSPQQQAALSGITSSVGSYNTANQGTNADLAGYASGANIGRNNADFTNSLNTALQQTADKVNSQFAGAGRYGSAAQTNALSTSLGNQATTAYANQYNQDVANQLAAVGQLNSQNNAGLSGNLSGAAATSGIGQQSIANLLSGVGTIGSLGQDQNIDANTLQSVGNQGWSNLGQYASLAGGIAGLGGTSSGTSSGSSSGTSNSNGTATTSTDQSPLGMLLASVGGVGNLFSSGNGGTSAIAGLRALSDRRAKEDIEPVGRLFDGQIVYRYRYAGQPTFHIGLIAQEVAAHIPDAVGPLPGLGGLLGVDYRKATQRALEHGKAA